MREEIAEVRPRVPGLKVSIEHLWLGLPVFALLWKSFLFPLPFLDFWWHLKIGEVIATTRSIPRVDLFSFTAAGQPFIVQNWLAELLYYGTYRLGGFPLLVFFNALMAAAAFLFVYHLCLEATEKVRIAAFVAFFAAIGNYSFLRPQAFSFFMFAVYSWILSGYRFRRRDALWALPVLMIFWVNLHGAFVLVCLGFGTYWNLHRYGRLPPVHRSGSNGCPDAGGTAQTRPGASLLWSGDLDQSRNIQSV